MIDLSIEEQNTIWINVMNGRGNHGSFLRRFGAAFAAADYSNKWRLEGCSLQFIQKYSLGSEHYLVDGDGTKEQEGQ